VEEFLLDLGLHGKVALVTGGGHGLGRSIVEHLAAEGCRVAVNYRRRGDEAEALAAEVAERFGVEARAVRADVSREAEVFALFDEIEQRLGRVEVLVNNAAVCPTCPAKDLSLEAWNETIAINLTGTFLASRELIRRLIAAGQPGRIVNVSSQAAFRGSTTGHAPYDASKGGMVSLTVSLAREVAPHGICVNAVAPGMMRTEMTAAALDANEVKYRARTPLGRIAETAEVARVVVFLASPAASYMTGATVDVSGGMLMR
jgi:3-oxoacyl-[acyl-carrier protein] reductase